MRREKEKDPKRRRIKLYIPPRQKLKIWSCASVILMQDLLGAPKMTQNNSNQLPDQKLRG